MARLAFGLKHPYLKWRGWRESRAKAGGEPSGPGGNQLARESWKTREARRVATVAKHAARRKELKEKARKGDFEAIEALHLLPRDASPVRVKNRCSITGRASGYMRKFGLSRQTFREMAHRGLIPGVRKASW
jgi:small subunit ribosomal protein S14